MRNGKGQFMKGNISPRYFLGKKLTEDHKRKIGEALKGKSTRLKGKKLTKEHIKNRTIAQSGENHYKWQGKWTRNLKTKSLEIIAKRKKPEQCELCGSLGRICFDHDHNTGKFRGWICHRCNVVLGLTKDNSELLLAIVEYLKKSKQYDNN